MSYIDTRVTNADWQFDGVVRLTRIGTAFVLFTVVIGFAAINTGNNSLYIALSFMLGCLLLSGIASKGGLKHLAVELDGIDEAWAMRPAHGRLRIINRSPIWNVRDVILISGEMAAPLCIPMIERRGQIIAHGIFSFQRRGLVHLSRVDLYTRYPFGFFLKKRRLRLSGDVVVFPRLLGEDIPRDRYRPVDGQLHPANRIGGGTEIHSFRDFVRGDSLRRVHWKKSASAGRWIIKQTEVDSGKSVHIVVDPFQPGDVTDDTFEEMISEAATFLDDMLKRDLEVTFSIPHVTLHADRDGLASMFRALALLEATREPVAQTVDRDTVIFTVADNVENRASSVGA
jgi:uncharacterized protein (DUF58 family)